MCKIIVKPHTVNRRPTVDTQKVKKKVTTMKNNQKEKQKNSEKSKIVSLLVSLTTLIVKWTKFSNQRTEWLDRLEKKKKKEDSTTNYMLYTGHSLYELRTNTG